MGCSAEAAPTSTGLGPKARRYAYRSGNSSPLKPGAVQDARSIGQGIGLTRSCCDDAVYARGLRLGTFQERSNLAQPATVVWPWKLGPLALDAVKSTAALHHEVDLVPLLITVEPELMVGSVHREHLAQLCVDERLPDRAQ